MVIGNNSARWPNVRCEQMVFQQFRFHHDKYVNEQLIPLLISIEYLSK